MAVWQCVSIDMQIKYKINKRQETVHFLVFCEIEIKENEGSHLNLMLHRGQMKKPGKFQDITKKKVKLCSKKID